MAESEVDIPVFQPAQLTRRVIIGFGLAAPTLAVPWLAGCSSSGPAVDAPISTATAVESPGQYDGKSQPNCCRVASVCWCCGA